MELLSNNSIKKSNIKKLMALLVGSIATSLLIIFYTIFFGKSCIRRGQHLTNSVSMKELKAMEDSFTEFKKDTNPLHRYGYDRANDMFLNGLREDFSYLKDEIYLDYAGSGLYQITQLHETFHDLAHTLYGNAHSPSLCSKKTSGKVDQMRERVLNFFNASEDEYFVIFTSGATGGLRLIGESFPFTGENSEFVFLENNHNSVVGIREFAAAQGSKFTALKQKDVQQFFTKPLSNVWQNEKTAYSLFAYPAEDNFNGAMYPLEWIERVHNASTNDKKWTVLLDAAAFVSTIRLDLSKYHPDFVTVSFYKMFGFPTGIGALIVRKEATAILSPLYWGGGQVVTALPNENFREPLSDFAEKFEAGTLNFHAIMELDSGFRALESVGGMERITKHVSMLTHWLANKLRDLKYDNGVHLVKIYGNHFTDEKHQGPIITFNLIKKDQTYYLFDEINAFFDKKHIHVRTGCMCNPGSCYADVGFTKNQIMEAIKLNKEICMIPSSSTPVPWGAVRLSIGYPTTFEDVYDVYNYIATLVQ